MICTKTLALLLAALPSVCHAQSLERLFFSPAEREAMDAQRQEPVRPAASEAMRFDGYLLRSNGSAMVWVNGRAQAAPVEKAGARQPAGGAQRAFIEIGTAAKAPPLRLEVGATLGTGDAAPRDVLDRGILTKQR